MNQRFGHFRDFMQFTDCHKPVRTNLVFSFLLRSLYITDGLPVLCSSWTSIKFMIQLCHILPVHNITIDTNNLMMNSAGASFTLRNWITECTSQLAGFGIDMSILNSHSTQTHCWKQVKWMQPSEWETWHCCHLHSSDFLLPPACFASNFWITLIYSNFGNTNECTILRPVYCCSPVIWKVVGWNLTSTEDSS